MSSQHTDPSSSGRVYKAHHRMIPFQRPDRSMPAGELLARRLQEELFIWLTTVDERGVPYSTPAPFVWDEEQASFLLYSGPEGDRERLVHIRQNPNVGLHLDMHGTDPAAIANTLILTGEAAVSTADPPADQVKAFVEKYQEFLASIGMSLQKAAEVSPVALRVRRLMTMVTSYKE